MIVKIISNLEGLNTGKGGHYYTLKETAITLRQFNNKVLIFSVGQSKPDALCDLPGSIHLFGKTANRRALIKEILHIIGLRNVQVLHAYDPFASVVAKELSRRIGATTLVTKCGGKSWPWLAVTDRSYVCFNSKDSRALKKGPLSAEKTWVLPARASKPNPENLHQLGSDSGIVKFVRIGRICKAYEQTALQAIRFVRACNDAGMRSQLDIIGTVQDRGVLTKLIWAAGGETTFHTDESCTRNASNFIGASHIVIGTGRSVQEAMSYGKTVLCPVQDSFYPAIIDENNVTYFMEQNFSERVKVNSFVNPDRDVESTINRIKVLKKQRFPSSVNYRIFNEYFDIEQTVKRLEEIYTSAQSPKWTVFDTIMLYKGKFWALVIAAKLLFKDAISGYR